MSSQTVEKVEKKVEKVERKERESCVICCENRSTFVKCLYCNFVACSDCTQKYLLENIDAKCMSCSKGWSLEFIQTNFSQTFVNKKYKAHRENILLEKEKALLPQTQIILENKNKVREMNSQIAKYRELIYNLEQEILFLSGNQNVYKKRQEKIINCIANECRGFLIPHGQHTLKCGICDITVCKSCRERREENKEQKEDDHKCDPQLVESIKAIEKECKPCPKCGSYIYKISGCDQLWCTQCRTAFSWRTGQIETGVVHNPHYWEYIRQHGNEDEEVRRQFGNVGNNEQNNDANNLLNLNECDFRFENLVWNRDFMRRIDTFRHEITELLREISHCQRYEIPRARVDIHDPKNNEDIRLKYLGNEIDEKKFKTTIQRRQKLNEYKVELVQILETFVTVFRESTIRYYRHIMEIQNRDQRINGFIKQWVTEIRQVRDFTVSSIEKLCDRFNYTFTALLKEHFDSYVRLSDSVFKKLEIQEGKSDKKKEEEKKQVDNFVNGIYSRGFRTYSEEMREVMKNEFLNKSGTEIAKELFSLWKRTPIDVKTYYRELELNDEKRNNEEKKEEESESDDDMPLAHIKKQ